MSTIIHKDSAVSFCLTSRKPISGSPSLYRHAMKPDDHHTQISADSTSSIFITLNSRPYQGPLSPLNPRIKQVSTSSVHSPLGPKPGTGSAVLPRSSARQREQPWSLSPVRYSSLHQILSSLSTFRSFTPL